MIAAAMMTSTSNTMPNIAPPDRPDDDDDDASRSSSVTRATQLAFIAFLHVVVIAATVAFNVAPLLFVAFDLTQLSRCASQKLQSKL